MGYSSRKTELHQTIGNGLASNTGEYALSRHFFSIQGHVFLSMYSVKVGGELLNTYLFNVDYYSPNLITGMF